MDTKNLSDRVKADIRSVLITSKNGLDLREFVRVFRSLTSYHVPFRRLGYECLEALLEDSSDVCSFSRLSDGSVQLQAVCDPSTAHVKRLVDRSRSTPRRSGPHSFSSRYHLATASSASLPPRVRYNLVSMLANYPQGVHIDDLAGVYQAECGASLSHSQYGFDTLEALVFSLSHNLRAKHTPVGLKVFPATLPGPSLSSDVPADVLLSTCQTSEAPNVRHVQYEDTVDPLKKDLISVISSVNEPVLLTDLPALYQRRLARSLQFVQFGYSSLLEAISQLGPPLALVHSSDSGWLCCLDSRHRVRVPPPPPLTPPPPTCSQSGWHTVAAQQRHTALSQTPLADIRVQVPAAVAGADAAVLPPSAAPSALPPAGVAQPMCEMGVVSPSYRFRSEAPALFDDGGQALDKNNAPLISIHVVKVVSPGQFVFATSAWRSSLRQLQQLMSGGYSGGRLLRQLAVRSGVGCGHSVAVRLEQLWWRGCVVSELPDQLLVLLVDVGRSVSVCYEDVFQLLTCFAQLPVLCAQASLADVQPVSVCDGWSTRATHCFSRFFTASLPVAASVLQQSQCSNVLRVCDVSTKDDVYVSDVLVSGGHATALPSDVTTLDSPLHPTPLPELHNLYTMMSAMRPSPEGEEPLSVSANSSASSSGTAKPDHSPADSLRGQVIHIKAECYDIQQKLVSSSSARSALMYRKRLALLERKLHQLQLPGRTDLT